MDTPISVAASEALPLFQSRAEKESGLPPLPGSSITRKLMHAAPSHTTALLMFCAEGDNRMDAQALVEKIALLCDLPLRRYSPLTTDTPLPHPPSWKGLFGDAPEQSLYG